MLNTSESNHKSFILVEESEVETQHEPRQPLTDRVESLQFTQSDHPPKIEFDHQHANETLSTIFQTNLGSNFLTNREDSEFFRLKGHVSDGALQAIYKGQGISIIADGLGVDAHPQVTKIIMEETLCVMIELIDELSMKGLSSIEELLKDKLMAIKMRQIDNKAKERIQQSGLPETQAAVAACAFYVNEDGERCKIAFNYGDTMVFLTDGETISTFLPSNEASQPFGFPTKMHSELQLFSQNVSFKVEEAAESDQFILVTDGIHDRLPLEKRCVFDSGVGDHRGNFMLFKKRIQVIKLDGDTPMGTLKQLAEAQLKLDLTTSKNELDKGPEHRQAKLKEFSEQYNAFVEKTNEYFDDKSDEKLKAIIGIMRGNEEFMIKIVGAEPDEKDTLQWDGFIPQYSAFLKEKALQYQYDNYTMGDDASLTVLKFANEEEAKVLNSLEITHHDINGTLTKEHYETQFGLFKEINPSSFQAYLILVSKEYDVLKANCQYKEAVKLFEGVLKFAPEDEAVAIREKIEKLKKQIRMMSVAKKAEAVYFDPSKEAELSKLELNKLKDSNEKNPVVDYYLMLLEHNQRDFQQDGVSEEKKGEFVSQFTARKVFLGGYSNDAKFLYDYASGLFMYKNPLEADISKEAQGEGFERLEKAARKFKSAKSKLARLQFSSGDHENAKKTFEEALKQGDIGAFIPLYEYFIKDDYKYALNQFDFKAALEIKKQLLEYFEIALSHFDSQYKDKKQGYTKDQLHEKLESLNNILPILLTGEIHSEILRIQALENLDYMQTTKNKVLMFSQTKCQSISTENPFKADLDKITGRLPITFDASIAEKTAAFNVMSTASKRILSFMDQAENAQMKEAFSEFYAEIEKLNRCCVNIPKVLQNWNFTSPLGSDLRKKPF